MNKRTESTAGIISFYIQIAIYQAIGMVIFATSRIAYLLTHSDIETLSAHKDSLPQLVCNAWRFDMQAISYIGVPMVLAALIIPYLQKENRASKFGNFMRHYFTVMLTILLLIVIGETFYYQNFNSRYNVVFFDFFDEGPWGLLQTMWQERRLMYEACRDEHFANDDTIDACVQNIREAFNEALCAERT